ncbi:MAG: nitrogen fixation protein NifK [Clostridiales Family XIII bacterium]|jgi:nitrogenase molybdenum-iron protein beta chain|nr:nitrogen fixation protein NifK [Clostridiales Family XIII bacterium]
MAEILQTPRGSCALGGALAAVASINKAVPILHAGPGCGVQAFAGQLGNAGANRTCFVPDSFPCTNMSQHDVVFGGIDHLDEVIRGSIELLKGELFFVLTGCTSDIIGDDVENLVSDYIQRGEPVTFANTGGFHGDGARGYETVIETALAHIAPMPETKDECLVNLLGIGPALSKCWSGNIEEIARILERLGFRVNTFFTRGEGYAQLRAASRASANIILSPHLLAEAEKQFESLHGIKSFRYPGVPAGPTETTDFVRKASEFLGVDSALADRVIREEEAYFFDYASATAMRIPTEKIAIVADANTAIGLTRFLANDYSQQVVKVIVTDDVPEMIQPVVRGRLGGFRWLPDPDIHFLQDDYDIKQALAGDEFDMILGSSLEDEIVVPRGLQFQVVSLPAGPDMILSKAYAGYRGGLTFLEDFINACRPVHIPGISL